MIDRQLEVVVSIPSVRDQKLVVSPSSTVTELKSVICREFKIEPALTNLLLDGKAIDAKNRLSDLDLSKKKIVVDYLWARQLILWGLEGQSRLRDATIFVAGAGAIGNEVVKNAAMIGVGRIVIADFDVVELSNVSRMFFFDAADIGKPKAEVLARMISNKYPYVETIAFNGAVESVPLRLFLESDVVVCGLDNVASRIYLSSVARKYLIPMIDGGINGCQARVQVYLPPDSPCPACHLPADKFADLIGLRNPCDGQASEEAKAPSLPTTISLVSSIMAHETTKILLSGKTATGSQESGPEPPIKGIYIADLRFNKYAVVELERNPECIVCGEYGISKDAVQRFEIPIKKARNSTDKLAELVRNEVGNYTGNILMFTATYESAQKIEGGRSLTYYKLKKGDFVSVILEDKEREYKQMIGKLV